MSEYKHLTGKDAYKFVYSNKGFFICGNGCTEIKVSKKEGSMIKGDLDFNDRFICINCYNRDRDLYDKLGYVKYVSNKEEDESY
ncbi:hypothetical protein HDU92_008468 [Lobulomyces angularis]|nr:hypothetical protein HDU92_008468 [Lobulomyces angularis]